MPVAHLSDMSFPIHSPDELVAALPYVLGFKPEESMVFVPMRSDLPSARFDIPTTPHHREVAWESIAAPFSRYAQPGASVGIVSVTADRENGTREAREFAARLDGIGIDTATMVWADDSEWHDLYTGESGLQTEAARVYAAGMMAETGIAAPVASRELLASSLVGDREPIAEVLPEVRSAAKAMTAHAKSGWALGRVQRFHDNGQLLSDRDAARLLLAVDSIPIRDRVWDDMTSTNATSHVALWTDLTRRAPDEVRAAPASLLGLASWLNGDGAKAWCALDQVPGDSPYFLAGLVAAVMETAMHPREWEAVKKIGQGTEFTPDRSGPQAGPARSAPGL